MLSEKNLRSAVWKPPKRERSTLHSLKVEDRSPRYRPNLLIDWRLFQSLILSLRLHILHLRLVAMKMCHKVDVCCLGWTYRFIRLSFLQQHFHTMAEKESHPSGPVLHLGDSRGDIATHCACVVASIVSSYVSLLRDIRWWMANHSLQKKVVFSSWFNIRRRTWACSPDWRIFAFIVPP